MMVINIIVHHGSVMRYYEGINMRRHVQGAGEIKMPWYYARAKIISTKIKFYENV
jgi:hypothetical protein